MVTGPEYHFTIRKVQPDLSADDTIIKTLKAAPGGLRERTRVHTELTYADEGNPGWQMETRAYESSRRAHYDAAVLQQYSDETISLYLEAAQLYALHGPPIAQANALSIAAQYCQSYPTERMPDGRYAKEAAMEYYKEALTLHEWLGNWDHAYRDLDLLHSVTVDTIRLYKRDTGTAPEAMMAELDEVIRRALHASESMQGPPDPRAHRVEEGEAGFSRHEHIGSDNISQCLTLFVQDPVSKKTGVVHINYETDLSTLSAFFDAFPEVPLQARVVGARFENDSRSRENICDVMRMSIPREVDIVSSNVWGGDAWPSAAVIDPESFTLSEAVPMHHNPNRGISNALVLFGKVKQQPILTDFDLTRSDMRAPLFIYSDAVIALRDHYIGKDAEEMDASLQRQGFVDRALVTYHMAHLIKGYLESYATLEKALDDRATGLRSLGIHVSDDTLAEAREVLAYSPLYAGVNAECCNQSLIAAIKGDFLTVEGNEARLRPEAVTGIALDPDAYKVMMSYLSSPGNLGGKNSAQTRHL